MDRRHTSRLAGRQRWDRIAKDLRPIYTTPTEAAAKERFVDFVATWGERYPGIVRLWKNAWAEFVPCLAFEVEVRRMIFSTNAVESLNARFQRAVRTRGNFPADQAALKCLYLTLRRSTPLAGADNDGPCAGSQPSTPSPSCTSAASSPNQ